MNVRTNIFRGIARTKEHIETNGEKGKSYPILEWCFDYDGKKTDLTEENFPGLRIVPPDAQVTTVDSSV